MILNDVIWLNIIYYIISLERDTMCAPTQTWRATRARSVRAHARCITCTCMPHMFTPPSTTISFLYIYASWRRPRRPEDERCGTRMLFVRYLPEGSFGNPPHMFSPPPVRRTLIFVGRRSGPCRYVHAIIIMSIYYKYWLRLEVLYLYHYYLYMYASLSLSIYIYIYIHTYDR